MSGRRSRDKSARAERAVVHPLRRQSITPTKGARGWCPGADLHVTILGVHRAGGSCFCQPHGRPI